MHPLPPERIDLGDVLLRWRTSEDAEAMAEAATASYPELLAWMPWVSSLHDVGVDEMRTHNDEVTREREEAATTASYALWAQADGRFLGAFGVHERIGPGGLEIGYWLSTAETGRGLATRAAAALTDAAFALDDIERVEIHCDERNERSAAVPRRLGYDLVELVERDDPDDPHRSMIWRRTTPIGPADGPHEPA